MVHNKQLAKPQRLTFKRLDNGYNMAPPLRGGGVGGGSEIGGPPISLFLRLRGSDHPPLTSLCMSVATGFPRLVYMTVVNSIIFFSWG